jgi:hypothetical protein
MNTKNTNNQIPHHTQYLITVRAQYLFIKNIKKIYIGTNLINETIEAILNFTNKSNTGIYVKDITGDIMIGPKMEYNKNVFIIVTKNNIIQNIRIPFWSIYYSSDY